MPRKQSSSSQKSAQVKQFRSDLAKLKKRGLVDSKIDARKVKPTAALKRKVEGLRGVISGQDKVYKVSAAQAKKLRATGQTVINKRLVLRVEPGSKRDYKNGLIHTKPLGPEGFERIEFPVPYRDLKQWIRDAKNDPALENLKQPGDRWAFRYFGNNSYNTYSDLDDVLERLEHYDSTEQSIDEDDEESMSTVYRGIEIFRVKRGKWPKTYKSRTKRKRVHSSKRMKERRPAAYERMREIDRASKKRQRSRLKKSPKKMAEFRARDAERKRKSRARKKQHNF